MSKDIGEVEYSDHRGQIDSVVGIHERIRVLQESVLKGFKDFLIIKETNYINFKDMTAEELAQVFHQYPIVIKSVLASVNVAGRAIKRDLEIDIDTYSQTLSPEKAGILAGYVKPILPAEISLDALCELDRWFYVDKEIRKLKGNWEKNILEALLTYSGKEFQKVKFDIENQKFELDAAYPISNSIEVGIDVKRIEARQDIHKRADEIVNKASKFKEAFPKGKFFAVLYYPFPNDHINLKERLAGPNINGIYFANETSLSINQQIKYLLGAVGMLLCEEENEEE